MPSPFSSLLGGAAGTHAADQIAMAALPLTVVIGLGAGARMVGLLLAVQAAAWLHGHAADRQLACSAHSLALRAGDLSDLMREAAADRR